MTMGEYIKKLREEKELSQEQLGGMLNPPVNRAAVNKWETGQVENLKRSTIQQLSEIFGVKPSELMCFEDERPDFMFTKNGTNFLVEANSFTSKDKRDISKTMNFILEQLENQQEALMFDGEALDETTRELLKASLENSVKIAKINAKQKFTPNKYRK